MSNKNSDSKPQSVQRAVICLWISTALVALITVVSWVGLPGSPSGIGSTLTDLITFGLLAFIAIKLGAGRSWTRWLFAVVYVLGSLMLVASLLVMPQVFRSMPIVLQGSAIVQLVLQGAALVFMFNSSSRQWFKAQRVGT